MSHHTSSVNDRPDSLFFFSRFTDEAKKDTWVRVVAPIAPHATPEREDEGTPAPIHSPLTLYATLLSPSTPIKHVLEGKRAYVHVVQTSGYNTDRASSDTGAVVRVSGSGVQEGAALGEGDGLYITVQGDQGEPAEVVVKNEGNRVAEVLLFDLE
jgi:quercetin 2,3-dioxygenase